MAEKTDLPIVNWIFKQNGAFMKKLLIAIVSIIPLCSNANDGTAFDGAQGAWGTSIGKSVDGRMRIAEVYPGVWKRITKDGKIDDSTVEIYNGVWVTKTKNKGNTSDNGEGAQPPQAQTNTQQSRSTPPQQQRQSTYSNGSIRVKQDSYGGFGSNNNSVRSLDELINN